MRTRIAQALSEPVMGFLALLAAALGAAPLAFPLAPATAATLDAMDWPILAAFALEYAVKLSLAPSRREFIRDPWHLLDVVIICGPVFALCFQGTGLLRSTPVLRLLRLGRAALLGVRSGGAIRRGEAAPRAVVSEQVPLEVHQLSEHHPQELVRLSWDAFRAGLADPDDEWFHVSGVNPGEYSRLAEALELPPVLLTAKLSDASHARIDQFQGASTLFFWDLQPAPADEAGHPSVRRLATLLVGRGQNLVTLSRGASDVQAEVMRRLPELGLEAPFFVRVIHALFRHLLRRHGEAVERFERQLHQLEADRVVEADDRFLAETFRIKRQIQVVRTDLWHLTSVIRAVAEKRVTLHGFEPEHQVLFSIPASEAEYLYETVNDLHEQLHSLLDLRLNLVSFQMNRVMRLLTLLTTLALIPTVVGGLLGMNILGNPWPVELPQVAFWVGAAMSLCLYVFAVKGWLR